MRRLTGTESKETGGTIVQYSSLCLMALLLTAGLSGAQTKAQSASQPPAKSATKGELSPEEIIEKFVSKEDEFYRAWIEYTYTQTAYIQVLSVNGAPVREGLTLVYEVVFNDDGSREVKEIRSSGVLKSLRFTPEDEEVIQDINPFALTADELPLYKLDYEGKEKADELDCYVFSVTPKSTKGSRMYFKGKIWVDDQDLQIVKTVGKPVPETRDNKFPEFETIRQVIDGKYWFPVWTHADSRLKFRNDDIRIEETITYDKYKRFGSKARIQYETPKIEP
jgi:hypothetical protein